MTVRAGGGPSARRLLEAVLDYAGMFPPAGLTLEAALREYDSARSGLHGWLLGRILLGLDRLPELEAGLGGKPGEQAGASLRIGAIATGRSIARLDEVRRFNERWAGVASVESVEISAGEPSEIPAIARALEGLEVFFEVRPDSSLDTCLETIAAAGAGAKIRTGGVTSGAFPDTDTLARFILASARAGVPFKATAGLHHALRGEYPLTHEADSETTVMHGFLNLSAAAALVYSAEAGLSEAQSVLDAASNAAFTFSSDGLHWGERSVAVADLVEMRRRFFRSFGSCSFAEPVGDLAALGVL